LACCMQLACPAERPCQQHQHEWDEGHELLMSNKATFVMASSYYRALQLLIWLFNLLVSMCSLFVIVFMLCRAVLCRAVLCCAVLCCAVLCCAVPCRAAPRRAVLCRAVPCCVVSGSWSGHPRLHPQPGDSPPHVYEAGQWQGERAPRGGGRRWSRMLVVVVGAAHTDWLMASDRRWIVQFMAAGLCSSWLLGCAVHGRWVSNLPISCVAVATGS